MELLANAASLDEVERFFAAGADAMIVGHEHFALRVPASLTLDEIQEAQAIAKRYNRKLYVAMNRIIHQDHLHEVQHYLEQLLALCVDAIQGGDPAIFVMLEQLGLDPKAMTLHWHSETTMTSYQTASFWANKGAKRIVLSGELSLEEIRTIKSQLNAEIQLLIQGPTCLFHSRRPLVESYLRHQSTFADKTETSVSRRLFVTESKRLAQKYPIFEDEDGTHIMSYDDVCMLDHLPELLTTQPESLFIETLLHTTSYNETMIRLYRRAIDRLTLQNTDADLSSLREEANAIELVDRPFSTGFYYKEQIY